MRGSPERQDVNVIVFGIIPAHAGLTCQGYIRYRASGDHPRACGAHIGPRRPSPLTWGSSPRMRGSRSYGKRTYHQEGIIPAHAGLTSSCDKPSSRLRDHPRACGAHGGLSDSVSQLKGSSPRMRGSLLGKLFRFFQAGIIPAHAGLTQSGRPRSQVPWDHPRACGAHRCVLSAFSVSSGSSPRMRGSRFQPSVLPALPGIIPAHAGLTQGHGHGGRGERDHPRACGAHTKKSQY